MKSIYLSILIQVIKFLISGVNWQKVLEAVESLKDDHQDGEVKRLAVLMKLKEVGQDVGKSLLSLALEIAVQKIKNVAV